MPSPGQLWIVTLAVETREPEVAVTVYGPPALDPAVKRPVEALIDPPPLAVQLNAGCGDMAVPNWSFAVTVNCCVPFGTTEAVAGETEAFVDVCLTVTVIGDVAVPPCGSLIVAVIVYVPAAVNVAVLVDAPLVHWEKTILRQRDWKTMCT